MKVDKGPGFALTMVNDQYMQFCGSVHFIFLFECHNQKSVLWACESKFEICEWMVFAWVVPTVMYGGGKRFAGVG